MQATVRMTRNGQVSIPIEIREALDLKPGDLIIIDVI
jgi:AbrB family looped-hinge helix DNA binding protein